MTKTTLTATAAMGAVFAMRLMNDLRESGPDGPYRMLSEAEAQLLIEHDTCGRFWHVGMIQLMARAERTQDVLLWHRIGTHLLNEENRAKLRSDTLWRFCISAPVPWMVARMRQTRARLRRQDTELQQAA